MAVRKTGRNEPCPCGSGKKYKRCCGRNASHQLDRVSIPVAPQEGSALRSVPIPEAVQIGQSYHKANDLVHAEHIYRLVLNVQPENPEALFYLGMVHHQVGNNESAFRLIEQAITNNPGETAFHYNLGNIFRGAGRNSEAIAAYKRAIALNPGIPDAHNNLGQALQEQGELDEALQCYEQAVRLQPDYFNAYNNAAFALQQYGKPSEALVRLQQGMALRPGDPLPHSHYLSVLNHISSDPQSTFHAHLAFAQQHEQHLLEGAPSHQGRRHPVSRLRIGYVSPDFRQHSVAHFIAPVLEQHNSGQFEIFCYYNDYIVDDVTRHLQTCVPHWHSTVGQSDAEMAAQVRADKIDILVDLAGHSVENRLLVFARKPAPVQVTWLGYPNTTGLSSIDYRLTDALADPTGLTEAFHTEKLVRLPDCFSCYEPSAECPDVGPLPATTTGHITFCSFNNYMKIAPETVATWATVLRGAPGSRLLLKNKGLESAFMQKLFRDAFAAHGIAPERIDLLGADVSQVSHLARYNSVDIGLDPFPYNGTTTTCDALWMGVPVITLAGQTHVARVGVSQLTNIGLEELVAQTSDHYVDIAVDLANDIERLGQLRQGLRARMAASPLTDAHRFTRNLEQAYRTMWDNWCGSPPPNNTSIDR